MCHRMHTSSLWRPCRRKSVSEKVGHLQTTPLSVALPGFGSRTWKPLPFLGAARMLWLSLGCGAMNKGIDVPGIGEALPGARVVRACMRVCALWSYLMSEGGIALTSTGDGQGSGEVSGLM